MRIIMFRDLFCWLLRSTIIGSRDLFSRRQPERQNVVAEKGRWRETGEAQLAQRQFDVATPAGYASQERFDETHIKQTQNGRIRVQRRIIGDE